MIFDIARNSVTNLSFIKRGILNKSFSLEGNIFNTSFSNKYISFIIQVHIYVSAFLFIFGDLEIFIFSESQFQCT